MYVTTRIAENGDETICIHEDDRTADYAASTTLQPTPLNSQAQLLISDAFGVIAAVMTAGLVQVFKEQAFKRQTKPAPTCIADDPRWAISDKKFGDHAL